MYSTKVHHFDHHTAEENFQQQMISQRQPQSQDKNTNNMQNTMQVQSIKMMENQQQLMQVSQLLHVQQLLQGEQLLQIQQMISQKKQNDEQTTSAFQIGLPVHEVVNMKHNPSQNIIQPTQNIPLVNMNNPVSSQNTQPIVVVVVQNNPTNGAPLFLANHERIYCNWERATRQISQNSIEVKVKQALSQIHSELNLDMSSNPFNLIGNLNLFSRSEMETKVISQIVKNNSNVSSEKIRQGKVVYCCTQLQSNIRKYGSILLALLSIFTTLLICVYSIDLKKHSFEQFAVVLYIIHIILWGLLLSCALYGIKRCSLRIISFGYFFASINIAFGIAIIFPTMQGRKFRSREGYYQRDEEAYDDVLTYFYLRLGIQLAAFFVGALVVYYYSLVKFQMNRFLVIVKELEEKKIASECQSIFSSFCAAECF